MAMLFMILGLLLFITAPMWEDRYYGYLPALAFIFCAIVEKANP